MRLLFLLLLSPILTWAQITATQHNALNAYVEFANQSATEVTSVVNSIIQYYPTLHQNRSWNTPRFTCNVQLEDYYLNQALKLSKGLDVARSSVLNAKLKELRSAAEMIDKKCKALDTYHKLEDYKQDNFVMAETLINELQLLLKAYKQKQAALQQSVEEIHTKMNASAPAAYKQANQLMQEAIKREHELLDSWTFNLKESVFTNWPVDKLEQSILTSDAGLKKMQSYKAVVKYPASFMWSSFLESVQTIIESKRIALNKNTFEAKKSDQHGNEVYLNLINYYNGTLVASYNSFLSSATTEGYRGLSAMRYFPLYEIRLQPQAVAVTVKPYKNNIYTPLVLEAQKTSIQKPTYDALLSYVEFIDETWRQTRNLQTTLINFNSTANYYKNVESYDRVSGMQFDYKNYQVPKAEYQKAIADSKVLPVSVSKSLNDQAEVLYTILTELDDLSATLQVETAEKRYEKDRLSNVYVILERQSLLLNLWDEKKETLYRDLLNVFNAYPASNAKSSWYVSGRALRNLMELDQAALFKAKAYYKGDSSIRISTDKIDAALRDVIAQEYENMKGIERIGRNNGACPYTPYEDLPQSSKKMSEEINRQKPVATGRYEHPYYRILYSYNAVVEDYNKFCSLSKEVRLLPTIHQPELFTIMFPTDKKNKPVLAIKTEKKSIPPADATPRVDTPARNENGNIRQQHPITDARDTKVLHDTVYIEKRDTVYLTEPGENLRSMEGYASNNIVLLLDVSGSMNTPEKLPVLKTSVLSMLSMMRPEDKVSIIAFSGKPKVLLESVSFTEEARIKKAIQNLTSSGKTDGNAALKLAYNTADEHYIRAGNNRIVLATDGEFAVSEEMLAMIKQFSGNDIFLSIFNFGKGMGSSKALENLATQGRGNYEHISKDNAELKLIREVKAKRKK